MFYTLIAGKNQLKYMEKRINDKKKNTASVKNPKIYCFNDPIDTPEMLSMLDAILYNNILSISHH